MPAKTARTLRPQDEIAHYTIIGPLGVGGMGEVYLAQDRTLERKVALKILPPDLTRSEERIRRFMLEARSASSLSHPNIVTIYEIGNESVRSPGEPDSTPLHYISMELVSGRTLGTVIHEEKADLKTLTGYLAQAADGLAKAHAAGIVHRDLKPGNIMVSADGFTKVLDFGLAKLTEASDPGSGMSTAPTQVADATGEGIVVGTAGYMSPEQVQGKSVDHRSDIFSFGCILYEAATRRRPFEADTGVETMHKILHDTPVPVEDLNGQTPMELRRLIRRCLQKPVDRRLQSMKDLALELRDIHDDFESLSASSSSRSAVAMEPAPPAGRRIPTLAWIVAGVVVAAGLALAAWKLQPRAQRSDPFQTMRMTTATDRGDVWAAALSPDGRLLAYVAGRPGQATLRVRQIATGSDVEIVPPSRLPVANPTFSPDGNYLYYTAPRPERRNYWALHQVPSLGGTPRERTFDVDSRVAFSPDGRHYAFWRRSQTPMESRLVVADAETDQERVLATLPASELFAGAPAWSPDGKHIAAIIAVPAPDNRSLIVTYDPGTGKRQELASRRQSFLGSLTWLRDGKTLAAAGVNLMDGIRGQVWLYSYPEGRASRVTNDNLEYESVSASMTDDTIAAIRSSDVSNLWVVDAAGGATRRITSVASAENSPLGATPVDSTRVISTAQEGGSLQLRALDLAGGESRRLTTGSAHSFNARSAGGTVLFNRADTTGIHVWRMNPDGGGTRRLTSGVGEQLIDISRDGRFVLVNHDENNERFSVLSTSEGRSVLELSNIAGVRGFVPDGTGVLVSRPETDDHGLTVYRWMVLPLDGGPPTGSTHVPGSAQAVSGAPDGRGVCYQESADPVGNIHRRSFDGVTAVPVTRFTEGRVVAYVWSPDGTRLAVTRLIGDVLNVWVTGSDGSRPIQVTSFAGETISGCSWLDDGRRLLVKAGTNASDAVLVRNFR